MLYVVAVGLLLFTNILAAPPLLSFTVQFGEEARSGQFILLAGDTPVEVMLILGYLYCSN
jgi:hypothetical protein